MSIQKVLAYIYFHLKFRDSYRILGGLKSRASLSKSELENLQLQRLNKLLNYSYKNVPYYREMFERLNLVENSEIKLNSISELSKLDILTKDIIFKEDSNLYSKEHIERDSYINFSGGSTGKPTKFLQDKTYFNNFWANFMLARSWQGVDISDSDIYIWGAPRDAYEGKKPSIVKVKDFIFNRVMLNCFNMSESDMREYIELLNRKKPKSIVAYAQSLYEIAKFAKQESIEVKPQNIIHTGAGTLFEFMREEMEEVFQAKVFNHYGSREIGSIASECKEHSGLHIMLEHCIVEILNQDGEPCKIGEEGEIVVTELFNYSMPFIRYKIGDIGVLDEYSKCNCGCSYPKLKSVNGRNTDILRRKDGGNVSPIFFIHLIGVTCNDGSINTFQVTQEEYDLINIKVVKNSEVSNELLESIRDKIRVGMGSQECEVNFNFVEDIPKSKTGKFIYTICKIK